MCRYTERRILSRVDGRQKKDACGPLCIVGNGNWRQKSQLGTLWLLLEEVHVTNRGTKGSSPHPRGHLLVQGVIYSSNGSSTRPRGHLLVQWVIYSSYRFIYSSKGSSTHLRGHLLVQWVIYSSNGSSPHPMSHLLV